MTKFHIRDELKDQGTNTLFLTSNRPELTTAIKVDYLQVKVLMFNPNSLRCFNCSKFGHTSQRCKIL